MRQHTQHISDFWFDWISSASWQIAIVVLFLSILSWLFSKFSPRLQYCLWGLVLLKIFLPPSIGSRWSMGSWFSNTIMTRLPNVNRNGPFSDQWTVYDIGTGAVSVASDVSTYPASQMSFLVWLSGALIFATVVIVRYLRIANKVRKEPIISEGPFRVALESFAMKLGLRCIPDLHSSCIISSPLLLGVLSPRIAIPESLIGKLEQTEIETVITHELVHCQRFDPLVGWLQLIGQTLFWFHPLVWWANNRMCHYRECVCDEISLTASQINPQKYGETILRVLSLTQGKSAGAAGLVGVFGNGSTLRNRMEKIMNFDNRRNKFGWKSRCAIVVLAITLLPMSAIRSQDDTATDSSDDTPTTPFPQIVETVPEKGAVDVEPGEFMITVTFDRDMSDGMSWTGSSPLLPNLAKSKQPHWIDKRTCVYPAKLEKGKVYRVGLNAKDFQHFKSEDGTPLDPNYTAFTTNGASKAMQNSIRTPSIVKITPALNATDVSPKAQMLKVTFNVPMGGGMSWTGGGEHFPTIPEGKHPKWSKDGKSCMMPVKLKPNWTYQLGLNSRSHNNFQSKFGIPLKPVLYQFSTGGK